MRGVEGGGSAKDEIVMREYSVLQLQLGGEEERTGDFDVAYASEGQLLLDIVCECFSAYDVGEGEGYLVAQDDAAVEHGLHGEAGGEGNVYTPMGGGVEDTETGVVAEQVGSAVEGGGVEASASGREVPRVFGV